MRKNGASLALNVAWKKKKKRHKESSTNGDSIGGYRDLRVYRCRARHVLQALDVVLPRVRYEGLGLHAHVLVIELQRVLFVNHVVASRSRHGRDPRLRDALAKRQEDSSCRQQDDGRDAEDQSPGASDLKTIGNDLALGDQRHSRDSIGLNLNQIGISVKTWRLVNESRIKE